MPVGDASEQFLGVLTLVVGNGTDQEDELDLYPLNPSDPLSFPASFAAKGSVLESL